MGEWFVDDFDLFPGLLWGWLWVVEEVEDVGCFFGVGLAELDGFVVGGVGVIVGYCSLGDLVVSVGVGFAELLFVVSDEDVPDAYCVFDGGVFLVV